MSSNYPCKCGHPKDEHIRHSPDHYGQVCVDCMNSCDIYIMSNQFHNFEGDNLKYLESLSLV